MNIFKGNATECNLISLPEGMRQVCMRHLDKFVCGSSFYCFQAVSVINAINLRSPENNIDKTGIRWYDFSASRYEN